VLLLRLAHRRLVASGVPTRPLLAPWYRLVGDGNRLLLEHGRSVVVLEGAAVRALLPALLPLLDGTRTRDELCERLGSAVRPAVESALELLAAHALLVEGPAVTDGPGSSVRAAAAGYGIAPAEAAERLAAARVGVVGLSPAGLGIARLLHASGIADVRRLSWHGGREVDLAVVAPARDEVEAVPAWNLLALERSLCWLPLRPFDGSIATVGPLVVPGESSCHECLLLRLAANVEYGPELAEIEGVPVAATADAALDALVVALAAHLAVRWVVGHDTTLPGVLHVVEERPEIALTAHHVLRVPRCVACSPAERFAPPLPWHEAARA
jgi:bacteriocin biosynthesis cyclodehydratase domain-containing protein